MRKSPGYKRKKLFPAKLFLTLFSLYILLGINGCSPTSKEPQTVSDFKLDTFVSITAYSPTDPQILRDCLALCDHYERLFSRTRTDSALYQLNNKTLTRIPEELGALIQTGLEYCRLSNGAFDLSIGAVSSLWDFSADEPKLPSKEALANALSNVNYQNIRLSRDDAGWNLELPQGAALDLGAIAKGYIADKMKEFLLEKGVERAVINLGGNVLCVGEKEKGIPFVIGVRKPFGADNETLALLSVSDQSVVSSGTYERNFTLNGRFYHHILNPATGYPYDNGLSGVTVISSTSVEGDCLSTVCFALGLEKGMALINSLENTEAIFVTTDGKSHYSDGCRNYIR